MTFGNVCKTDARARKADRALAESFSHKYWRSVRGSRKYRVKVALGLQPNDSSGTPPPSWAGSTEAHSCEAFRILLRILLRIRFHRSSWALRFTGELVNAQLNFPRLLMGGATLHEIRACVILGTRFFARLRGETHLYSFQHCGGVVPAFFVDDWCPAHQKPPSTSP